MRLIDLELDLDVFAGPFDLLLTLVLREEVDLLEVDLAEIVIAYIDHLERRGELDLEAATEFLVLIAALLELKSRLMLPGEEAEELELDSGEAAEELLARLLDAHRYRAVAAHLERVLGTQAGSIAYNVTMGYDADDNLVCALQPADAGGHTCSGAAPFPTHSAVSLYDDFNNRIASQDAERRTDEELEPEHGGGGIPRKPEHQPASRRRPEQHRLSRADGDGVEDELAGDLFERRLRMIVVPDRGAARGDEDVGLGRPERARDLLGAVGGDAEEDRLGPRLANVLRDGDRVGLDELAGRRLGSDGHQLVSGDEDPNPRPAVDRDPGGTGGVIRDAGGFGPRLRRYGATRPLFNATSGSVSAPFPASRTSSSTGPR